MIELGKFCFIKTKEPNLSYFSKPVTFANSVCEVSALNFDSSPTKYAIKNAQSFSAGIYTSLFKPNL